MPFVTFDSGNGDRLSNGHPNNTNGYMNGVENALGTEDRDSISNNAHGSIGNGLSHRHTSNGIHSLSNGREVESQNIAATPVAIVGMALRLPGAVNSTDDLWDLLINKKDGRCRIPGNRYNIDAFHSPSRKPGTVSMQHGYFLQDDLEHLDAAFFSMNKAEVAKLDPQQRLLLEVVWECMENGGQTGWRGRDIGCYVGVFGEDWLDLSNKDTQHLGMYRITGSGDFAIANRVSYEYDLKGPSMTIRTGCSSALVGLHEACQALYSGECSSAVVAGTNLIITPTMTIAMTEQGVLSPTGSCKTFDAAADGYARGEAINAIYIKRLDDALRDGDPIRAVIRSTSTNCDGKTPGIAYPSSESHEQMIRRAYRVAGIRDISQTGFVECHGTGTAVGDPLEAAAIANVFEGRGTFIGSVKPNVGHSEGASGITSLIKAVLALEHKMIPPNINFSVPNPKIPFEKAKLKVPLEPTPWPEDRRERASVNSFGIGGANAHVIIDSASSFRTERNRQRSSTAQTDPRLLLFSANNADSLRRKIVGVQQYVESRPMALNDMAYTLGLRREHLTHRAFSIASENVPLEISNFQKSRPTLPSLNFVFTGQGAQWPGMGKELIATFESFRNDIRKMDRVLQALEHPPSWSIEEELSKVGKAARIDKAEFSQPLCTAVQIGLVNLLSQWDIRPATVVGHSSGEIAAAYAAKAITTEAAIIIAYYRGQVTKLQMRAGGMAAVGLGREKVTPYLVDGVTIACENSPQSITLSGDVEKLDNLLERVKAEQPDTFCRRLRVEMAYHSHHMQEIGEAYEVLLVPHVTSTRPTMPFYSSVTGKVISKPGQLDAAYWRQNMESPVLFYTAAKAILDGGAHDRLFLEVGPHPALAGPLRQIFQAASAKPEPVYVPTLARDKEQVTCLLTAAGQMYQHGVPIDFSAINGPGNVLTDLPLYPWHHDTKYWSESRVTRGWRLRQFPPHELLGSRMLESSDLEPAWRNVLRLEDIPWMRDHKIIEDIVFPCAGYVATAGEAISQITGSRDYTVRRLVVKTALVLRESDMTELITSFKPLKLTDSLESIWYDFTISSYNGSAWTKHCVGQARAGPDQEHSPKKIKSFARQVRSGPWYLAMKKLGLNYGPQFQRLKDISASPTGDFATASLYDEQELHERAYALHPVTIDQSLQLFTVAMSGGIPRRLGKLAVPATIGQIYIGQGSPLISLEVSARPTAKGTVHGDAIATSNNEVVLSLQGGTFAPFETEASSGDSDTLAAARLEWRPDIDSVPAKDLMRPLASKKESALMVEKLGLLCMIETAHQIASLTIASQHLKKFGAWLDAQVVRIAKGEHDIVPEAQGWAVMDSPSRLALFRDIAAEVDATEGASVGKVIRRILENCQNVFEGKIDPVELLVQDSGLTNLYKFYQEMWDCKDFFSLLGHAKPTLRVLEIGAGTGGTTAGVLKDLKSPEGVRMYSKYSFTDISSGFFVAAKERFKEYQGIDFAVLDISKNPVDQGFEAEGYDLIIASNVLHATPELGTTLRNVRKLLASGGRLFLQELCPAMRWINYIMGVLPGWWLGDGDQRDDQPYVSPERWNEELRNAGFTGADAVVYDDEKPYQINANIISTASDTASFPKQVTLLYDSEITPWAQNVEQQFFQEGYVINWCSLEQTPPANQDVISLLDLEGPFFDSISAEKLSDFQCYLSNSKSTGTLWVTKRAQVECEDPRYGLVLGMARTIRSELSLDFATFEVDRFDLSSWEALVKLYEKFRRRRKEGDLNPDYEYALYNGIVHTGRYHWVSAADQLCTVPEVGAPKRLEIGKYGLLDSLSWGQIEMGELVRDQVEVSIRCVGLNFKDVLVSMGIVDGPKDKLGLEGSGVVCRVGPEVKDLSVGDRVFISDLGCFSTRMVTSAKLCARIPDGLTFENAATMPCVYSTVIHSLINVGRLEKGETVLIQSACGGVGLAAIQICRMMGAEIYATVGNEEKAQYLIDTFRIPRNRIFDSRSTSFLPNLMRETNGRGVDIVLNSLSGELLHASWQCVAKFGKMLEIGKRDFIGHGMLSMDVFESNRSFFGVDLAQLAAEKPETCHRLLEQCITYYRQGEIEPIRPVKVFEARRIGEAFRYMQKGQHIGKIVVKMPEDPDELPMVRAQRKFALSSEASYLLVGGLGGLGRAVSTWMVENGARHLVYLSRSAGRSSGDKAFFQELEVQGCNITAVAGSVANLDDVERAVAMCSRPIAGVIQMSMVLRDRAVLQLTHEDWNTALSSKVDGTWNLHRAFQTAKLDFFVLFSSISGIVGQWGQANYAAANTFLDSFVQHRHYLGLPASVIDVGVMEDVGYVSQNPAVLEQFRATGAHTLEEKDLLDAMQMAISKSRPAKPSKDGFSNSSHFTIGLRSTRPLSDPSNRTIWKRDIRMALYRNLEVAADTSGGTASEGLKEFLSSTSVDPAILNDKASLDFLTQEIGHRICSFMLQPEEDLDVTRSLSAMGVDSLVSIEIRNWWRRSLGLEISVLEIMNAGSVARLGQVAVEALRAKHESKQTEESEDTYLLMKAP